MDHHLNPGRTPAAAWRSWLSAGLLASMAALGACDDCPLNRHRVVLDHPDDQLAELLAACRPPVRPDGRPALPAADAGSDPGAEACANACRRVFELAVERPEQHRLRECTTSRDGDGGAVVTITFGASCR